MENIVNKAWMQTLGAHPDKGGGGGGGNVLDPWDPPLDPRLDFALPYT